jgi:heme exporter protein D
MTDTDEHEPRTVWDIAAQFLTALDKLGVVNSHEHQEILKRILRAQAREQQPKPITGRGR